MYLRSSSARSGCILRNMKKTRFSTSGILASLILAAFLALCLSCAEREEDLTSGGLILSPDASSFTVRLAGRDRGGSLFVPASYNGTRPYSLVFCLHGAGGNGMGCLPWGFNRLAEELDFIMVYPDGAGLRWDSPDDIPFFTMMLVEFKKHFVIDPARVYVTGHSAGAIQAYELAAALPRQFAAIAPVAGAVLTGNAVEGALPVSVLHIHAVDDMEVPYNGASEWGVLSAPDSVAWWRKVNEAGLGEPAKSEVFCDSEGMMGVLWHGVGGIDTAALFHKTGGHTWLPMATEYVADFLYNHPPRRNSVRIDRERLPHFLKEDGTATVVPILSDAGATKRVEYFANGKKIGESSKKPFAFDWQNPGKGLFTISARAEMSDGTKIPSTLNPTVLAAPPALGPEGLTAISSSDENEALRPEFAIDGDLFTRWSSAWSDPQTLTIDLGSSRKVEGVTLYWEQAFARTYRILVSETGASWTPVVSEDKGKGGIVFHSFAPAPARYVRFEGLTRETEWGHSLWEVLVHPSAE